MFVRAWCCTRWRSVPLPFRTTLPLGAGVLRTFETVRDSAVLLNHTMAALLWNERSGECLDLFPRHRSTLKCNAVSCSHALSDCAKAA